MEGTRRRRGVGRLRRVTTLRLSGRGGLNPQPGLPSRVGRETREKPRGRVVTAPPVRELRAPGGRREAHAQREDRGHPGFFSFQAVSG